MRRYPDLRTVPFLAAALCLGAGVVAAGYVGTAGAWRAVLLAALAVATLWTVAGRRFFPFATPFWQTAALAVALVALGGYRLAAHYALPPHHVARLVAAPDEAPVVTLEGRVAGPVAMRAGRQRFRLEAEKLVLPDTALAATGRVQVAFGQPAWRDSIAYPTVRTGDGLRITGRLRLPPAKRNPADFDYGDFLEKQGVFATLAPRDSADVQVRRRATPSALGRARRAVAAALDRYVPSDEARQVLTALLLGDRSALDADTRQAFVQTGLMHLLAVSGLHVLLVGMVLFGLLQPFLLRMGLGYRAMQFTRAAATLAVLAGYALLTGASPSVVRAVVMAAVLIGGIVTERPSSALNSLGLAAGVLLVARPTVLFEPGFQLSFAAVAGLVLLPAPVQRWVPPRTQPVRRWLVLSFVASAAATLATAPILLYHFGRLPLAGLVLNFAAIGLTMAAFADALLLCAFSFWPALAALLGAGADWLVRWLVWLAEAGETYLGSLAYDGYVTNGWLLAALALGVGVWMAWPYTGLRARLALTALACLSAGVWIEALQPRGPHLDVVFFDVGQGDAALVSLPGGKHLLIDAGVRDDAYDAGARTLLPHLRYMGIEKLDGLLVTHPHADHMGGVPALLQGISVGQVWHNGAAYPSALHHEVQFWLDTLHVPSQPLHAGDHLELDPAVALDVLAPATNDPDPESTNDASVVLRVAFGDVSILFAGDAEAPSETRMVARYDTLLASTVVKVGHHGSITSSTAPFVARVRPRLAVVSVAAHNVYRLPSDSILVRWQRAGARLHLTRDGGALWLRTRGQTVETVDWRR